MARKLKTYITNLGFFELAIAAPSIKAALEAWGMSHNAFQHGFAKQTEDPKIVAATMEKPGIVLKRPVGTKGPFSENAELPKELWKGTLPKIEPPKKKAKADPKTKAAPKKPRSDKADEAAILSFEKAKERRDKERRKEEKETARSEKKQARIERAVAKAEQATDQARERHEDVLAVIEKEREKLERRTDIENERWEKERNKLEEARERAME
jgi:hypothetical protein